MQISIQFSQKDCIHYLPSYCADERLGVVDIMFIFVKLECYPHGLWIVGRLSLKQVEILLNIYIYESYRRRKIMLIYK